MIISQYVKVRLQYRTDLAISTIGMFILNATNFAALWILFRSISTLAGWSFYEMLFLYGFALLSAIPLQLFFDNIWQLRIHLYTGNFIKYYFRPLNMMFYYMSETFDIKAIGQIILALFVLFFAAHHLTIENGVTWNFARITILIILLVNSSLIIISVMLMASSAAFWISNSFSILSLIFKIKDYSRYPVTIFPTFLKYTFSFIIPVAFSGFYPVQLLIRTEEANPVLYLSPIVGIIFFYFAYFVWNKGVTTYNGTGS